MEMPNIPNPESAQGFQSNDDLHHTEVAQDEVDGATQIPPKRKPGRPKGSTKKNQVTPNEATTLKVKRPVGRPRKDGFPAGSVPSARPRVPRQPRHSTGVGHRIPGAIIQHVPIDPNLQMDDWAIISREKPIAFLGALVAALTISTPKATTTPTVEDAFNYHLTTLIPNTSQSSVPSLYSLLKTFWLPTTPPYFVFTSSPSSSRLLSEHRFFYWDPQLLILDGITCPHCPATLVHRGCIKSGPIKVYDFQGPFFIIGCEYTCSSSTCTTPSTPDGRKFASTDASIFRCLPQKLKDEFPACLLCNETDVGSGPNVWNWQAMGVSKGLWNLVLLLFQVGMGKEGILQVLHGLLGIIPSQVPTATTDVRHMIEQANGEQGNDGENEVEQDLLSHENRETMKTDPAASGRTISGGGEFLQTYGSTGPQAEAAQVASVRSTQMTIAANSTSPGYDYSKPLLGIQYASYPFYVPTGSAHIPEHIRPNLKRPYPFSGESGPGCEGGTENATTKRSPRHCCKCGSQDCKGKGGRAFCQNGCQDCGKLECRGRNSRRPDKKCDEGWMGV